jgi:hypothetical protein
VYILPCLPAVFHLHLTLAGIYAIVRTADRIPDLLADIPTMPGPSTMLVRSCNDPLAGNQSKEIVAEVYIGLHNLDCGYEKWKILLLRPINDSFETYFYFQKYSPLLGGIKSTQMGHQLCSEECQKIAWTTSPMKTKKW